MVKRANRALGHDQTVRVHAPHGRTMAKVAAADLIWAARRPASRLMNVRPRGALALALVPGLAGCAVGPDFVTPPPPVAAKYLEWRNGAIGTSREDYRDWWRAFHDPVLDRLIEMAYNQNLTLLSAGTQVLRGARRTRRRGRRILPAAAAGLWASPTTTGRATPTPASSPASDDLEQLLAISAWRDRAAWELDFWGKFRRGVESADAAYLASIATYDDVLVTLLGDVASDLHRHPHARKADRHRA